MYRSIRWGSLCALLLLAAGTLAFSASAPAGGGIGVIDLQSVITQCEAKKLADDRFSEFIAKIAEPLKARENGVGLSPKEFELYEQLIAQPAKDAKAIGELETKAKANYDELMKLNEMMKGGEQVTAEQKARFEALANDFNQILEKLNALDQNAQQSADTERRRLDDILTKTIDATVGKIAKEQKLNMVLSKNVQTGKGVEKFVLWNDQNIDITEKVLKSLNESFKPTMFDQQ